MRLWQMSFYGGALILAAAFLRREFQNRVPREAFLALWAVAVLRLLVPFTMCSDYNVYAWAKGALLTEGFQGQAQEVFFSGSGSASDGGRLLLGGNYGSGNGVLFSEGESGEASKGISYKGVVSGLKYACLKIKGFLATFGKGVYWIGFLASTFFYLITYVRCRKEFRCSLPVEEGFLLEWKEGLSLKRKVSVRQSQAIAAPVTYGVLHPVILLPKQQVWEGSEQLGFVLEHEAEHIRHFDAAKKLLLVTAACIHWFNPLVWRMLDLANKDIELACDERVVRRYGLHSRSSYAFALIHMEEKRGNWMALGNGFSGIGLEERIVAIMNMKKRAVGAIVAAVIMVAGVTAVFATAPAREAGIGEGAEGALASEGSEFSGNASKRLMYNISVSEDFADYAKLGLSYDPKQGCLMYQNERVGYFKDEMEPNTYRRFYTEEGTVGIVVVRDSSGRITDFHTGTVEEVMGEAASGSVATAIIKEGEGENSSQVTAEIAEDGGLDE